MAKLSNLLVMINLLKSGRKYSIKELSEYLEVSERVIREYKVFLEEAGIYVDTIRGPYGGYILNKDIVLPNVRFDKEDISYKVNEEAALEVMRQLRLKNLGGIIVVDFINMKKPENKEKIIEIMQKEALKDRSRVEIYGFTNLGLVEIARKKV